MTPERIIFTGVAVHLLLLSAVFDIYFISPIQHGMPVHKSNGIPPAKRVVLFVADGLRSTSLFDDEMRTRTPFLHDIVDNIGSWGFAHTQMPTESRPGHVAMLAGFNEDPSAITRGWQSNPVDFDSVINQSTNAWCWGSPDIVNLFNIDNLPRIHLSSYSPYLQDFSGKNATTVLDEWVFQAVEQFVEEQEEGGCKEFCESGNIIFLHLLGIDTAGHSFKPKSKEYMKNIAVVNEGISKVQNMLDTFFGDTATTYIFTSDHGMTNWGSHGDGSEHETQVPFITWGAGIQQNHMRQDINQTDIAPFISSLLGIGIPINSLGTVPLKYLNSSDSQKALMIHANAMQLLEQYIMKHNRMKADIIPFLFRPFMSLTEDSLAENHEILSDLLRVKKYQDIIRTSYDLIYSCKEGLSYYVNYYRFFLLTFVTIGFVGWIIYVFISIGKFATNTNYGAERTVFTDIIALLGTKKALIFTIGLCATLMAAQSLPAKYYFYTIFPLITWNAVARQYANGFILMPLIPVYSAWKFGVFVFQYIVTVEFMIGTFFDRLYLIPVLLYIIWEIYKKIEFGKSFLMYTITLTMFSIVLETQTEFKLGAHCLSIAFFGYYQYKINYDRTSRRDVEIIKIQLTMMCVALLNSMAVNWTITNGSGLWWLNQLVSWTLLGVSLIMPFFVSTNVVPRLTSIILALLTPYVLMGVGFENLFMFIFAQCMMEWAYFETEVRLDVIEMFRTYRDRKAKSINEEIIRRCFFLLGFIMLGYFGVGNTAKMNSFDPMWTRCFVTVFSPFTMAALILIKLLIPFLIVLSCFKQVLVIISGYLQNYFLILFLISDFMVLHLLYYVTNEGSWLEIGVSVSRFVVANVIAIFVAVLYQIAHYMTVLSVPTNFQVYKYNEKII